MTIHAKDSNGVWRPVTQPSLKLSGAWRNASAVLLKVNDEWREVWPGPSAAPKVVGVSNGRYGYLPGLGVGSTVGLHYAPAVPYWRVVGDKARIASCKVDMRWTPVAPKSPVEHTISWDAPVGWAIYYVAWQVATTNYYYIAAMTETEAQSIVSPKYVVKLWSPRDGGWFAYMPACWDVSGVTVPMRSDADGGLDPTSGYTPFPPNRSATSALADYTVANGYSDMTWPYYGSGNNYTSVTITLKDASGGTLHSWTGGLPFATTSGQSTNDIPGLGVGPAVQSVSVAASGPSLNFYWPEEWRGLFDNVEKFGQAYRVVWGRDVPNKGEGEWDVLDRDGIKIGDFRLALRYETPGVIEIRGVNLAPDLVGMGIMRTIVEHGVLWCPTEDIIIIPPDKATYAVMKSWGWQEMRALSPLSLGALPYEYRQAVSLNRGLFMKSDMTYNRFARLGLPAWQEVTRG